MRILTRRKFRPFEEKIKVLIRLKNRTFLYWRGETRRLHVSEDACTPCLCINCRKENFRRCYHKSAVNVLEFARREACSATLSVNSILNDSFGNYVIQRLVNLCPDEGLALLILQLLRCQPAIHDTVHLRRIENCVVNR